MPRARASLSPAFSVALPRDFVPPFTEHHERLALGRKPQEKKSVAAPLSVLADDAIRGEERVLLAIGGDWRLPLRFARPSPTDDAIVTGFSGGDADLWRRWCFADE